jgi:hypothetical protein
LPDLIITNGDAAGELLRRSFAGTEVLPWRDVLHEGPMPLTGTLAELTEIRAAYLAGDGDPDYARSLLAARDRGLAHAASLDRVMLWFEHDLYDQLQLLQLLDWFAAHPRVEGSLLLVQASEFLGRQTPEQLQELKAEEAPVRSEQLAIARRVWAAFRADTPEAWHALLDDDLDALPYLRQAVLRMLEELPGPDGLTRTERQILQSLAAGALTPPALFVAVQRQEEAVFMGDFSFWKLLDGLALARHPLVEGLEGAPFKPAGAVDEAYFRSAVTLTPFGADILAGRADHASRNRIDRWWGGTHLTNEALWRFDPDSLRLISPG